MWKGSKAGEVLRIADPARDHACLTRGHVKQRLGFRQLSKVVLKMSHIPTHPNTSVHKSRYVSSSESGVGVLVQKIFIKIVGHVIRTHDLEYCRDANEHHHTCMHGSV